MRSWRPWGSQEPGGTDSAMTIRPTPQFAYQNIRLDDGTFTRPDDPEHMGENPRFLSAMRMLDTVFGPDKTGLRIVDLGCLEGGYAVEFARRGFTSLGVEVREVNIAACNYVKSKTDLPNLAFAQDDAWNVADHGVFDAVHCAGLLYHIEDPKRFLHVLSSATSRVLILHTHFAVETDELGRAQRAWRKLRGTRDVRVRFDLSPLTVHEGLRGRWYTEFAEEASIQKREGRRLASWENDRSFWILHEYLLDALSDVGFDVVLEQFDSLAPNIAEEMTSGYYATYNRSMFVGIKS